MTAPIAQLDDEWENFASFSTGGLPFNEVNSFPDVLTSTSSLETKSEENVDSFDNFNYSDLLSYESMEDLVHTFDETLASCFRLKYRDKENNVGTSEPMSVETLNKDKIWKRLTDNYGLVQPLNWETSHVRTLHLPALCLPGSKDHKGKGVSKIKDSTEDKVPEQQIDYHQMIEYNVYTEENNLYYQETSNLDCPDTIPTADEVIEELEGIMQDAADINAIVDYEIQQETGIIFDENAVNGDIENSVTATDYRASISSLSSHGENGQTSKIRNMSLTDLNALNRNLEEQINLLSAELLKELNLRDELQYANELKNSFISKVLEVQYKREGFCKSINSAPVSKKFSRLRRSATSDSVANQGRFLTTVIPCNKGDVITLETLSSLIKILNAIKDDSDEVPSLLTSYILKVLCPASSGTHVLQL